MTLGIVGERKEESLAQKLLEQALDALKEAYSFTYEWVDTNDVEKSGGAVLNRYSGLWSAPGGKFHSLAGTLDSIRYARDNNIPFLATCGGFHHTIMELAQDLLNLSHTQHQEYDPTSETCIVTALPCSLRGQTGTVFIKDGTLAARLYPQSSADEVFACGYGLHPAFRAAFDQAPLSISGTDASNEIRILEIPSHRFFMATLFIPQARSTQENPHPILQKWVAESCRR